MSNNNPINTTYVKKKNIALLTSHTVDNKTFPNHLQQENKTEVNLA